MGNGGLVVTAVHFSGLPACQRFPRVFLLPSLGAKANFVSLRLTTLPKISGHKEQTWWLKQKAEEKLKGYEGRRKDSRRI